MAARSHMLAWPKWILLHVFSSHVDGYTSMLHVTQNCKLCKSANNGGYTAGKLLFGHLKWNKVLPQVSSYHQISFKFISVLRWTFLSVPFFIVHVLWNYPLSSLFFPWKLCQGRLLQHIFSLQVSEKLKSFRSTKSFVLIICPISLSYDSSLSSC